MNHYTIIYLVRHRDPKLHMCFHHYAHVTACDLLAAIERCKASQTLSSRRTKGLHDDVHVYARRSGE